MKNFLVSFLANTVSGLAVALACYYLPKLLGRSEKTKRRAKP
jgi:hypothetical protein